MLINLRNALMAGKRTPTAKDYVQSGLVAMWDGIENAGHGVHGTGGWVDLISGKVASLGADSVWTDKSLIRESKTNGAPNMASVVDSNTNNVFFYFKTVEIVARLNPTKGFVFCDSSYSATKYGSNQNWNNHAYMWFTGSRLALGHYSAKQCPVDTSKIQTYAFTQDETNNVFATLNAYVNGSLNELGAYNDYWSSVGVNIGGAQSNRAILGEMCALRFYDRVLSATEIAHNYRVDKLRFGLP